MPDRVDLDRAFQPLPTVNWPGGGEVEVKPITFAQQRVATQIEAGTLDMWEALPALVAQLVPSKTRAEIEASLDASMMWLVVHYANRNVDAVKVALERLAGNAEAGTTAPASPPPTPSGTSSAASPGPTAVPCGA
jgi:hypothetical protein